MPKTDGLILPKIFEKLRLTEKGQLKRSALVLFGNDPGKFYLNIFIKIVRFAKDDTDIRIQEMEEGNLVFLL